MVELNPTKSEEYHHRYYVEHREALSSQQRAYAKARLIGPDGDHVRSLRRERVRLYRLRKPDVFKRQSRESRERLRAEVFSAYGDRCDCCGETSKAFLTLDHVNRDGNKHRAMFGGRKGCSSRQIFLDLKRRGWPKDGFRILCMNCNWATRFGAECPHTQFVPEQHRAFLSVV